MPTPTRTCTVDGYAHEWAEYDSAAEWCARRGLTGDYNDPLPENISAEATALINADPEAFTGRVSDTAYMLACEATEARCALRRVSRARIDWARALGTDFHGALRRLRREER